MSNVLTAPKKETTLKVEAMINPFNGLDNKPMKKNVSELTLLKTSINKTVEGEVKSVSKYYSEFRKTYDNINKWLKLQNEKGRTFDPLKCHEILMVGNLKAVTDSDRAINEGKATKAANEGKKYVYPVQWSANRMFVAFVHAVETTVKK